MNTTCPKHLPCSPVTSSNLQATQRFYAAFLHETSMTEGPCLVCRLAEETLCFGLPQREAHTEGRETRDGFTRIVFGVEDDGALRRIAKRLNERNLTHSGIYADLASSSKLHLHDPDGTRVEFVAGLEAAVVVHFA